MDRSIPNGLVTYTAGGAIARGEFVKFGETKGVVVKCTAASDAAIGIAIDAAGGSGEVIPVALLGIYPGALEIKAAGAVTLGAEVVPTGAEETVAGTTELICGRALEAATTAGDMILVAHCIARAK